MESDAALGGFRLEVRSGLAKLDHSEPSQW